MENVEIARLLDEVADLLEIQGDNPFKVRAYRNAVRTVQNLTRPLADLVDEEADLEDLPGIGHDMAGYIREMLETGRLERLEGLEKQVPKGLPELMRVEGLGPKRARQLHDELGIRSLGDLEEALERGRVEELRGFGARSVQRIRQGVAELRARPDRVRLADAEQLVRPLLQWLRDEPAVERVDAAGSYRRRRETVGDIDLLVVSGRPAAVMDRFASFSRVGRVEAAGRTRSTVVLEGGLRVDLRVVRAEAYGAALHYFTGSKAHNIAVRRLGVERGLKINEYGVFRVPSRKGARPRRISGAEEEEVFRAVDLPWIPPELREDRGEIEVAREGRLPALVREDDIRGDLQMHSTWSDGEASIRDMALAAAERGYEYIAITDHSHEVRVTGGMDASMLEEQWKEIAAVRRSVGSRIRVLRGMEVDILEDGSLDLDDDHLRRLDVVVASVHTRMRMTRKRMTERVIQGIRHPATHILAHPTGRLLGKRRGYDIDMEAVLRVAAETGVAVEINAQPDRLDLNDIWARRARELGVTVVIDTDAHTPESLAFMRYGVDQARRGWVEAADVLNTRPLARLERWLARRPASRKTPTRR